MNPLRRAVELLFESPIRDMTYVTYLTYVNESGKITARSLLELAMVTLTYLDEMEKKIALYDANFKEIEEILAKLVEKKVEQTIPLENEQLQPEDEVKVKENICPVCSKTFKTPLALSGHARSHKNKTVV